MFNHLWRALDCLFWLMPYIYDFITYTKTYYSKVQLRCGLYCVFVGSKFYQIWEGGKHNLSYIFIYFAVFVFYYLITCFMCVHICISSTAGSFEKGSLNAPRFRRIRITCGGFQWQWTPTLIWNFEAFRVVTNSIYHVLIKSGLVCLRMRTESVVYRTIVILVYTLQYSCYCT